MPQSFTSPQRSVWRSVSRRASPRAMSKGTLCPRASGIEKMDVTDIPYPESVVRLGLLQPCLGACAGRRQGSLREIFRVLKPGRHRDSADAVCAGAGEVVGRPGGDQHGREADRVLRARGPHPPLRTRPSSTASARPDSQLELKKHDDCLPNIDAARFGVNRDESRSSCAGRGEQQDLPGAKIGGLVDPSRPAST